MHAQLHDFSLYSTRTEVRYKPFNLWTSPTLFGSTRIERYRALDLGVLGGGVSSSESLLERRFSLRAARDQPLLHQEMREGETICWRLAKGSAYLTDPRPYPHNGTHYHQSSHIASFGSRLVPTVYQKHTIDGQEPLAFRSNIKHPCGQASHKQLTHSRI